MQRKAALTTGPVGRTLISLTIPMVVGHLAGVAFNLTDTYFVAQLGTEELAAMGFSLPVVMVVFGVTLGLGIGTSAVVSQAIGRGNSHEVRRLTTHALLLSLLIVGLFSIAGVLTVGPLFRALGADPTVLELIKTYMVTWYIGMVFMVVPMVGNSAIRATGDTKTPSLIMLISAGINIVLDPLLIFGWWIFPRLGLFGAALATVIARALATVASLLVLSYRHKMLAGAAQRWSHLRDSWKRILAIGLPAAATNILVPVSLGAVTRIVAGFGHEAIAAIGAGMRVEAFAMRVVAALAGVMVPFVGQNWGAKKLDRVRTARRAAFGFSVIWGLANVAALGLLARPIATLFSDQPQVIHDITIYLWIVPVGYGLKGIFFLASTMFNALNRPLWSAGVNAVRMLVLYIPLAYVGSLLMGYAGVLGGITLSNILAGLISMALLQRLFRRMHILPAGAGGT